VRCLHTIDRDELRRRILRLRFGLGIGLRLWFRVRFRLRVRLRIRFRIRLGFWLLFLRLLLQLLKLCHLRRRARVSAFGLKILLSAFKKQNPAGRSERS
jgi:hypothetical protein